MFVMWSVLNKYMYFVGRILNIAFFVYTFIPDKTWDIFFF